MAQTFNPSTWGAEAGGSPSPRSAWSTEDVLGQSYIEKLINDDDDNNNNNVVDDGDNSNHDNYVDDGDNNNHASVVVVDDECAVNACGQNN